MDCEYMLIRQQPILKYTFKMKAQFPNLIQHQFAILVHRHLSSPPHQQQVQIQLLVLLRTIRTAYHLPYLLATMFYYFAMYVPLGSLDEDEHHDQFQLIQHQQLHTGLQHLVEGVLVGVVGTQCYYFDEGMYLFEGVSLICSQSLAVGRGAVVDELLKVLVWHCGQKE